MLLEVEVCQNTVKAWQLVGIFVTIVKIVVPLVIIITAIVPFFYALMKGTAEELAGSIKKIFYKIIAGVVIFLVPTIIGASVKLLVNYTDTSEDTLICTACFEDPNGSDCKMAVKDYEIIARGGDPKKSSEDDKDPTKNNTIVIDGGNIDTDKMDVVDE